MDLQTLALCAFALATGVYFLVQAQPISEIARVVAGVAGIVLGVILIINR